MTHAYHWIDIKLHSYSNDKAPVEVTGAFYQLFFPGEGRDAEPLIFSGVRVFRGPVPLRLSLFSDQNCGEKAREER